MDIQAYIESGILEEYALGELSEAQRAEVERVAGAHPAVRQELDDLEAGLAAYGQAHAVTPPADLRERVLSHWQQAIRPAAASAAPAETVVRAIGSAPAAEPAGLNWRVAASLVLLLASLGANLFFYSRWQRAETDLTVAQSEQARLATVNQTSLKARESLGQELAVLRDDQFKAVVLAGTPNAPTAKARVLYNAATRTVYVDVRQLPAPPAGKQYQLWALDQGKPVDAGMLTATTAAGHGLQQMKDIASAQAFAVTVEPTGGSANPTLSTMTVMGQI